MLKKSGTYKGKSNKLGGGGRFAQITTGIMKSGKSKNQAQAIAATIGRKKYGSKKMAKWSAQGRKRAK